MRKIRCNTILALIIIGVFFYAVNYLTPEYGDDYGYRMFDLENGLVINNLNQYFYSTFRHYFDDNGRVLVHAIVRIFVVFIGKTYFNFANTFVFLLFLCLLVKNLGSINSSNIFFCSACVLLLFPSFNDTFLWMDGSVNYLWSATFVLFFLFYFNKSFNNSLSIWKLVGGCVLSLLAGATQEGITFPLSLSLLAYLIIKNKSIKRSTLIFVFAFVVGSFVCSLCPATLARTSVNGGQPLIPLFISKIINGFLMVTQLRALYVLLVSIAFVGMRKGWQYLISLYKRDMYMVLFNAWIFSFGIIFGSGFTGTRVAFGEELFSVLLVLLLISEFSNRSFRNIKMVVCSLATVFIVMIIFYSIPNYFNSKNMLTQIMQGKTSLILAETVKTPCFVKSYIVQPFIPVNGAYNCANVYNRIIAACYHKDSLAFFSRQIFDDIEKKKECIYDITKQSDYPYYIIPVNSWNNKLEASFILTPTNYSVLPLYIKPFAPYMTQYTASEVEVNSMGIITIDNKPYLCIDKNPLIDNRVKEIRIEN